MYDNRKIRVSRGKVGDKKEQRKREESKKWREVKEKDFIRCYKNLYRTEPYTVYIFVYLVEFIQFYSDKVLENSYQCCQFSGSSLNVSLTMTPLRQNKAFFLHHVSLFYFALSHSSYGIYSYLLICQCTLQNCEI